ncbi:hypothetical protein ACNF49_35285 [Actinomadura sp. ATCC 39365]
MWKRADLHASRAKSGDLTSLFIELAQEHCGDLLDLATPSHPALGGSPDSYRHPAASAIVDALADNGVMPTPGRRHPAVGLRQPIREFVDERRAAEALSAVLRSFEV